MLKKIKELAIGIVTLFIITGCVNTANVESRYKPQAYVKLTHPEWTKNATIYQLNTRQFTAEGTFKSAEAHLPRLKKLGVDIIWLMPVQPIGEKNRKGSLGSPYSVKDYYGVNPELGSLDDLKNFVDAAHQQGFHVILDWAANHTAWDNYLVTEHPDWYKRDYKGDFRPTPWFDWHDIIDLDFDKPEVRKYMTDAMKYWVKEVGVDGYRCDTAGFVPIDFWNNVRVELDEIKPVFMLAEWETRDLHQYAFDMSYAWSWWDAMHQIAQGRADLNKLFVYYSWNEKLFPKDAMRMIYVSNHDVNAWEATDQEAFGNALNATIVLSVIGEGMPLIYNGQEAGNNRRLAFFERDPIVWKDSPTNELYTHLFSLKKQNTALWNGHWGATMIRVPNSNPTKVFSFVRGNAKDKVFTVINFSDKPQTITFNETLYHGQYRDFFADAQVDLGKDYRLTLAPWQYKVFVK